MAVAVGIDLGTTNSVISATRGGPADGDTERRGITDDPLGGGVRPAGRAPVRRSAGCPVDRRHHAGPHPGGVRRPRHAGRPPARRRRRRRARLLRGDSSIPAARGQARRSVIYADAPAVHGPPPTFQGAILDVDGVLVDSPHYRAWREALQELMDTEWADLRGRTSYSPDGSPRPCISRSSPVSRGWPGR